MRAQLDRLAGQRKITHTVIIVGAGVSGIAVSFYLSKNNIEHIIIEKSWGIGGIWHTQRWPGVRCDTEIISYSYSFMPLASERPLVSGAVIAQYLGDVVSKFHIDKNIFFGVTVQKAVFDSRAGLWRIHTSAGEFTSRFLVNANGYFADEPYVPEFAGVDAYRGTLVHLSRLDSLMSTQVKNILLIGSGAAAISAATALAGDCRSLTLLQRSPSYIYDDKNRTGALTRLAQFLYRRGIPHLVALVCFLNRLRNDCIYVAFRRFPRIARRFFERHWTAAVGHKSCIQHFQPRYNPWEQRVAVSIGLKAALKDRKLRIATGDIKTFVPSGVVLHDGREFAADLCILATGHDLRLFKFEVMVDGEAVDTKQINFYKGMMMGGIPNYFHPFGVVHAAWPHRVEMVAKLISRVIVHMDAKGFSRVWIGRRTVTQRLRITPNYIMRSQAELPAVYGTWELPSLDNLFRFFFREKDYRFSAGR